MRAVLGFAASLWLSGNFNAFALGDEYSQKDSLSEFKQQRADNPSLQVAIRQPLIDYGTTVGLETLKQHVEQIVVPNVSKDVDIPVLGKITVEVTSLKCVDFKEPRELTHIIIDDDSFHARAQQVSAAFHFHWKWKTEMLPISGSGEGTATFLDGDVDMKFLVQDEGRIMIFVEDAQAEFDDIDIRISGSAISGLYNIIIQLFHEKIVRKITDLINQSIRHDVPKALNSYLSNLPSAINISGLPMDAAFKYSLYTHGFILVSAFPTIGKSADSPSSIGPSFVKPSQVMPVGSQALAEIHKTKAVADQHEVSTAAWRTEEEQLQFTAHTLIQAFLGHGMQGFPTFSETVSSASSKTMAASHAWAIMQETCPTSSTPLNITDESVLADTHMATAYVNDAVPQCLLWGLNQHGLLQYCVRDGDVPGVRLITDVFQMLIPGIYQAYPHRSIAMTLNATAEPKVVFVDGQGLHLTAWYETRVWVLPEVPNTHDRDSSSAADKSVWEHGSCTEDGAVQVAVLETELSVVADMQYESTQFSDLSVKYTVKDSPFKIHPISWERTIQYVLQQLQDVVGIHALWQLFVQKDVASRVHVQHAAGTYWKGWYKLSVDFQVDI